jgi:hypothetical protein
MNRSVLTVLAACLSIQAAPALAQQSGPNSRDSTWNPPVYNLNSNAGPAGSQTKSLKQSEGATTTDTRACTPKVVKTAEGKCTAGQKTIFYADGCGGQKQTQETCASGSWAWFYAGPGLGGGGTATSSVIMLACVQDGTENPLPAESCGPKPSGSPCLLGQSYQVQLPDCPASVYRGFWP